MASSSREASPDGQRYVDIHPVGREELRKQRSHGPVKFRGTGAGRSERRPSGEKSFTRQVSLESGVAMLAAAAGHEEEHPPRPLPAGIGRSAASRKGDFSMFRTKSTLNKQNSMLPLRADGSHPAAPNGATSSDDSAVEQTVPAGRYFAALRGPELDQVRVSK